MPKLTVSQLVDAINQSLTDLDQVVVEGEVDEFKIVHSKWVTFQLKDETSTIGCFMTVWQYKTQIEDGMLVQAQGRPTLRNKGFFSFVVSKVQPTGEGALKRAFELLKQKLEQEGLFATERKRALPRFPQHIALITSREAAAYSDFIKVLTARHGGLTISFLHTQVQGADAPRQLTEALSYANTELPDLDAIVMVRGGGSLEDLQAFNDEMVVRTVAASRTPIIVGVGHERDTTLAELAADVRASTPSNAAELLMRTREEIQLSVENLRFGLSHALTNHLQQRQTAITHGLSVLRLRMTATQQKISQKIASLSSIQQRLHHQLDILRERLKLLRDQLQTLIQETFRQQRQRTEQVVRVLNSLSPAKTLARGYSITRTTKGQVVKSATKLKQNEVFTTTFAEGSLTARVAEIDSQSSFDF